MLRNLTPFAADTSWTRDERGAEFWLVAVRASFDIDPDGRQSPSPDQTAVQHEPVFEGDPQSSGLLFDRDFALSKDGTDVMVAGRAFAPREEPAASTSLRLKVHEIDKSVTVLGDRRLYMGLLGLTMSSPAFFREIPLGWGRTYGGWDRRAKDPDWDMTNPAGRGFATHPAHLEDTAAPNVEYPDTPYRGPGAGRPAAFGPVAHHWKPRVTFGGTYDDRWHKTRDPLLPADFSRRYFRSAPADQQTRTPLIGYEEVRLGGFTPEGFLGFLLPRLNLDIITSFRRYGDIRQQPSIHTLWLFPDRRRFEIIYVSALEVPPGREEKLLGSTVRIRPRIGVPPAVQRTGVWSGPE